MDTAAMLITDTTAHRLPVFDGGDAGGGVAKLIDETADF